jgi:fatty-acyl-CoA synthase
MTSSGETLPDLPRLSDYVELYACRTPEADAAVTADERLTYAGLAAAVRGCAATLVHRGIGPGDRVATLTTPGAAFLVTFLASASIGAIWCGLNPRHSGPELDGVIERLEPRLIFARGVIEGRDYRDWLAGLPAVVETVVLDDGRASSLRSFVAGAAAADRTLLERRDAVHFGDICLIVFTSGTTGEPKGVMISHRALVGASRVQLGQWPVSPLRVLNNLPISHIGAVGDLACFALVGGGATVFSERFNPQDSLRLIRDERVTVFGQVPTQFELTLACDGFTPEALAGADLIVWGGAQASPSLLRRLAALRRPLATSYGQTETVGSVTFTPPNASLEDLGATVGRVVPPYGVRIADEAGNPLPPGHVGEVQVRSPYAMSGYWRAPAATAAAHAPDGWLRTGDLGRLREDGVLALAGRASELFKSGGYNIAPAEIERALMDCPGVAQAVVVSIPDGLYGAVGAAAVVVNAGAEVSAADLTHRLAGNLANYKIPKQIVELDQLPMLPIGKVDKDAVRRLLSRPRSESGSSSEPEG